MYFRCIRSVLAVATTLAAVTVAYPQTLAAWTQVQTLPSPEVAISWQTQDSRVTAAYGIFVYRRDLYATGTWTEGQTIATVPPAVGHSFTDKNVELGKSYEYRVMRLGVPGTTIGYAQSVFIVTVDAPLQERRGTLLFVVDETLPPELEQELRLAEMDLAGDGWDVTRITSSQHDPTFTAITDWPSGKMQVPVAWDETKLDTYPHMLLKQKIVAAYHADWNAEKDESNVKALYLFGRLPVARSGEYNLDGHDPGRTAPTDAYYADIDGVWTDDSRTIVDYYSANRDDWNIPRSENGGNVIGDGKFDQQRVPFSPAEKLRNDALPAAQQVNGGKVDLMTGRVDFGRMSHTRKNEREHLRDYIQKAHSWKHTIKVIPHRTSIADVSDYPNINNSCIAMVGGTANHVNTGWSVTNAAPYLAAAQIHPHQSGLDVGSTDSKVFFGFTTSSRCFDWYQWTYNIIRSPLAQAEWGYLGCYGTLYEWTIHHLGAGLPVGYSYLCTINADRDNIYPYNGTHNVQINLLGDPTLRLAAARPPRNLTVSANDGHAVLEWQAPSASPPSEGGATITHTLLGYHVCRSTSPASGYTRLTPETPITATEFTDTTRPMGHDVYYQVRAVHRTAVPTGTYRNQSQGIFNVLRANDTSNTTPVADAFEITATRNAPAYLPFGGTGTGKLTPIVVKNPEKGQIRWGGGKAHYVANLAATGADSVTYRLWDGLALSDPVTIPITIVLDTAAESRLLLGWRFPSGDDAPDTPGSTYRKTPSMLASTLTRGSASPSAAGIARSNKGFPIGGTGPRGTEFNENSYIGWTVAPAAGNWQSLDRLAFFVFGGNRGNGYQPDDKPTDRFNMELRYSTDNFATYETLEIDGLDTEGKLNAAGVEKNGGVPCSARLNHPALQGTTSVVQFRLYFWGALDVSGQTVGLGKSAETPIQNPFDIAVYGTTSTTQPATLPTVAFDGNGATSGLPPATLCAAVDASITLPGSGTLANEGFALTGWNTQAGGGGTTYAIGANFTVSANTTLYAIWDPLLSVEFQANGGAELPPAAMHATEGAAITLPEAGTLANEGFAFTGWNTQADGGGTTYAPGATFTVSGDTTLYAAWRPLLSVSFDANGGTGTPPATMYAAEGSAITLPRGGALANEGFGLAGWNTQADGGGTAYAPGATFTVSGAATLYAVWSPIASVAFHANGGTGAPPATIQAGEGAVITLPGGGTLARLDFIFTGWNTQADGDGTTYAIGADFTVAPGATTLYAVWTPLVAVAFHSNGGTGTPPATMYAAEGFTIILPGGGTLVRAGFILAGWNTQADGEGTTYDFGANFPAAEATILYAAWTPLAVTVAPEKHAAPHTEDDFTIQLTSNTTWTAASSDSDWLRVAPDLGSDAAALQVHADANPGPTRYGTITVTGAGVLADPRTITVTQASAKAAYNDWVVESELTGPDALFTATPHNDGITNFVKFALGLDGSQAARYTDTGYFTTDTKQVGTKTILVFTYAVNKDAETATTVTPHFSKDLQEWDSTTPSLLSPQPAGTPSNLSIHQAEGDFTDGKGFFRLEIRER